MTMTMAIGNKTDELYLSVQLTQTPVDATAWKVIPIYVRIQINGGNSNDGDISLKTYFFLKKAICALYVKGTNLYKNNYPVLLAVVNV